VKLTGEVGSRQHEAGERVGLRSQFEELGKETRDIEAAQGRERKCIL
jgi:hypothetical protein